MTKPPATDPLGSGPDAGGDDELDRLREEIRAYEQYRTAEIHTFGQAHNPDRPRPQRQPTVEPAGAADAEPDRTIAMGGGGARGRRAAEAPADDPERTTAMRSVALPGLGRRGARPAGASEGAQPHVEGDRGP